MPSPDERLRLLEREAAQGDPEARRRFRAELLRAGKVDGALEVLVKGGFLTRTSGLQLRESHADMNVIHRMLCLPGQGHSCTLRDNVSVNVINDTGRLLSLTVMASIIPNDDEEREEKDGEEEAGA